MRLLPIVGVLAIALTACGDRGASDRRDEAESSGAGRAAETSTPAAPAPAPVEPSASSTAPGAMPAPDSISYTGFGPAKFGASPEEIRMAWGKDMVGGPGEAGACYYLYPQPKPQDGYRLAFMVEGDKFVRLDVDAAGIAAPGGGQVGMGVDEIRKRYPGIEEQPHKYVEGGKNLRHKDAGGGVLVFATDPAGKVTEWRVGLPPQVDYVEGCG